MWNHPSRFLGYGRYDNGLIAIGVVTGGGKAQAANKFFERHPELLECRVRRVHVDDEGDILVDSSYESTVLHSNLMVV